jgi:pimeloyl-ACP methyl ester carboxylesterase
MRQPVALRSRILAFVMMAALIAGCTARAAHADPGSNAVPGPVEGYVEVNGVRLQYLDWGGSGPALIFVHGMGDDPHVFDDLAPAFADRFRVVAYARRGSGNSDSRGPYDVTTLTEDLRGLMDALGIPKATLVGHSAGGDEITAMAATHPRRVSALVYLDAAYDWSDPDFHAAFNALPTALLQPPASSMVSFDAYRAYQGATSYQGIGDMRRIEAHLRQGVVVEPDGHVRQRTRRTVLDSLYGAMWTNKGRDYAHVLCPALAIYPQHLFDVQAGDVQRRDAVLAFEQKYWDPFRTKSINRIRRELAHVEIVHVNGIHTSFFLTERQQVVATMMRFLSGVS